MLTKADKVGPEVAVEAELVAHEVDPDLEVVTLSARRLGRRRSAERIGERTVALIGESGAGKSTLVSAARGRGGARGRGPRGRRQGRHTTHRELHLLPGGGVLVDTPGIREVGIWTDTDAVADAFADIDELAERCRFRDCTHGAEPGCAVLAAVEAGELAPSGSRPGGRSTPRRPPPSCAPTWWSAVAAPASSGGWPERRRRPRRTCESAEAVPLDPLVGVRLARAS
ncbi:MAG: GTPase RsgA [Acidimicrobiales bacterium]